MTDTIKHRHQPVVGQPPIMPGISPRGQKLLAPRGGYSKIPIEPAGSWVRRAAISKAKI